MGLSCEQVSQVLEDNFAPWIHRLAIEPLEIGEGGSVFRMPANSELVRGGDILCGQALASLADTVSVLSLLACNDELRMLTTVDMNMQFLRPLKCEDVLARTVIQANGKRMAQVRCEFRGDYDGAKLAASAGCTFLYL